MADAEVQLHSPLQQALVAKVKLKIVELGWVNAGEEPDALADYIVLMLVNQHSQEQLLSELCTDLLSVDLQDETAVKFVQWLFEQKVALHAELNGSSAADVAAASPATVEGDKLPDAPANVDNTDDAEMGDAAPTGPASIPTGPKAMRNGNGSNAPKSREKRLVGQMNKAMDRSTDASLHRIKGAAGAGRISTHNREPPRGPRGQVARNVNAAVTQGRPMPGMPPMSNMPHTPLMPQNPATGFGVSQQQQMELYAMFEHQARMMVANTLAGNFNPAPAFNPAFQQGQHGGRSLFDRVSGKPQRQNGSFNRRSHQQSAGQKDIPMTDSTQSAQQASSSMDVEPPQAASNDPSETVCRFNLACTKPDCSFGHQSPAAPPGTSIDMSDKCAYGAACQNKKCAAKHPSPAQKTSHQATQNCRFWPNCTKPDCPFKHPERPFCRNGADCNVADCKFTHSKIMCKFDPCLNARCFYKHAEGQKRGNYKDKVWTAPDSAEKKEHVSERKFVNDENAEEELIIPGSSNEGDGMTAAVASHDTGITVE